MKNFFSSIDRALPILLLTVAAVFLVLHYVHLRADFPNHSPWMDWSKYTDEGWYGDAAIRHYQLGHWYVPGDFNPAAALPVWPFVEALTFEATGVSLVAARALTVTVFAGILLAAWFLVARRGPGKPACLPASVAVLLLACNPFCFVFTRIAIIEPLLVLLTLLALLAARRWGSIDASPSNLLAILGLGLLLPVMVLTKTTALFLMPAVFWMVFAACGYRIAAFLRVSLPVAGLGLGLWLIYFLAIIRPHFLIDYRYLFAANAYTGMDRENFVAVLAATIKDGSWMGTVLYPCASAAALFALAAAIARPSRLAASPLIPALLLWSVGYMAFLAYHNNLQPRYYLVIAVPLTLLLPVVVKDLILPRVHSAKSRVIAISAVTLAIAAIVIPDAIQIVGFVRHPEYTLLTAANDIAATIAADRKSDPTHNPLILSISGSDISLMTGLPSICDDFGTLELVDRIRRYKPGWYVAWNQVEDDKLDAIAPQYQLERVAAFPAMDDPDRNLLILYKMVPATTPPSRTARKPVTPRRLRTRLGQQPSVNQLEH
jgi:4-amino-4-deoxy-L-arabinose transferase-like glycosyltransferase